MTEKIHPHSTLFGQPTGVHAWRNNLNLFGRETLRNWLEISG
jgi:hypothetical protein